MYLYRVQYGVSFTEKKNRRKRSYGRNFKFFFQSTFLTDEDALYDRVRDILRIRMSELHPGGSLMGFAVFAEVNGKI